MTGTDAKTTSGTTDLRRVLVIGSSPMSLLIAIAATRAGYQVTLTEGRDHLGGAWATDEIDGKLIDRACHLLEPLAPARQWTFEQLGQEPATYSSPPVAVTPWNSVWPIPSLRYRMLEWAMAWPAAVRHLASVAGGDRLERERVMAECRHDLGRLTRRLFNELRNGPSAAMTLSPQPFRRLCAMAERTIEDVRLSSPVSEVWVEPSRDEATAVVCGLPEIFDHVVIPSGADVDIVFAGVTVGRRQFRFDNHHLLIEVSQGRRPLSYLAYMADAAVRRVVDTGPLDPARPERRRYLAHVRRGDTTAEEVVELLGRHGFVDPTEPAHVTRRYKFTSVRTVFDNSRPLPRGIWTPDTYGDLTDNLARLLATSENGEVDLVLPFGRGSSGTDRGRPGHRLASG